MFKALFAFINKRVIQQAIMHEAEHEVIQLRINAKLEYWALIFFYRTALQSNLTRWINISGFQLKWEASNAQSSDTGASSMNTYEQLSMCKNYLNKIVNTFIPQSLYVCNTKVYWNVYNRSIWSGKYKS